MGNTPQRSKPSTVLTKQHIELLKASTNFTEEEIREWHRGFIHDCPNGQLDKKRFMLMHQRLYPNGKTEKFCKLAFNAFDRNGDGVIDFEEFLLSISATGSKDVTKRLGAAFDLYDASGDGLIDQKELTALITAMYDLTGEVNRRGENEPKHRAQSIIKKFDVSGDKKLDKAEFIEGCKSDPVISRLLVPGL